MSARTPSAYTEFIGPALLPDFEWLKARTAAKSRRFGRGHPIWGADEVRSFTSLAFHHTFIPRSKVEIIDAPLREEPVTLIIPALYRASQRIAGIAVPADCAGSVLSIGRVRDPSPLNAGFTAVLPAEKTSTTCLTVMITLVS